MKQLLDMCGELQSHSWNRACYPTQKTHSKLLVLKIYIPEAREIILEVWGLTV
jgi:hypothetical protein